MRERESVRARAQTNTLIMYVGVSVYVYTRGQNRTRALRAESPLSLSISLSVRLSLHLRDILQSRRDVLLSYIYLMIALGADDDDGAVHCCREIQKSARRCIYYTEGRRYIYIYTIQCPVRGRTRIERERV